MPADQPTPADTLRQAAQKMRARALAATPSADPQPGGWSGFGTNEGPLGNNWSALYGGPAVDGYRTGTVFSTDEHCDSCVGASGADVQHIASWHPAVALTLADLLDKAVGEYFNAEDVDGFQWTDCPVAVAALAVAHGYLGTAEQVTA